MYKDAEVLRALGLFLTLTEHLLDNHTRLAPPLETLITPTFLQPGAPRCSTRLASPH